MFHIIFILFYCVFIMVNIIFIMLHCVFIMLHIICSTVFLVCSILLEELNTSIFITLQKISGTTKCEKHRTISLMSHITKLIICVVMNRVRGRTLQEIAPEQYGFMPDKGTRNAIFVLRAIEKQKGVYAYFIDYSKAFDTVRHEPLINLLKAIDVDSQGCVASPHLFAIYTEMIMISLDDKGGFRIGGRVINNLRYADNTVILAEIEHKLQHLMDIVVQTKE